MKLKLKTEGLEGEALKLVTALNAKLDELPESATAKEMQDELNAKFKDFTGADGKLNIATKAEFDAIMNEAVETSLMSIVKKQGTTIARLESEIATKPGKGKSIADQLSDKSFVDEFKKSIKQRGHIVEFGIAETKAAAVTAVGSGGSVANDMTAATGLRVFPDAPFFEIKRGTPFILDFVNVGTRTEAFVIWWDEVAHQGDFAITAEGAVKPLIQYKFDKKSSDYKKEAAYSTITDEFFMDLPAFVTQIKRLGEIDMMNAINATILVDMIAALPGFTYTLLNASVFNADDYAAIGAAIAQIQALFFSPTVLVLNPADAWSMKLLKDNVGRYQMPPFMVNDTRFEFGQVIVDPRIASGHFLVGDAKTFNVDFRGDTIVRVGYNASDFITNQQTVVVERYFYDYISTNRLGAWVYGNFATIKAAINKVTNSF